MENFQKVLYFVSSGIAVLMFIFYILNFFTLALDPSKKASEAIIFLIGSMIVLAGLFFAYKYGYSRYNFWQGMGIYAASWVCGFFSIMIGLLFFNGPIHWQ